MLLGMGMGMGMCIGDILIFIVVMSFLLLLFIVVAVSMVSWTVATGADVLLLLLAKLLAKRGRACKGAMSRGANGAG